MLDDESRGSLTDEANDQNPQDNQNQPQPAAVADDLPRPPAGRRSKTRPAGPPMIPPPPPVESITAGPADDEPATPHEETEPAQQVEEVPATEAAPGDVPAAPGTDETSGSAAEEAAPSRPKRTRRKKATEVPAEESQPADEAAPATQPVPDAEPVAAEPVAAEPDEAPVAAPPARKRSTRSRAARTTTPQPQATEAADDVIEQAISAVEAKATRRRTRGTRQSAAGLLGDEVPTDAFGEVDTQQALASLAAAIAGRREENPEAASAEPAAGEQAESEVAVTGLADDGDEEEASESAAVDVESVEDETSDDLTSDDESADEQAADGETAEDDELSEGAEPDEGGSPGQRRRRRRGGRRRRRSGSSASADGTDENSDGGEESGTDDGESEDAAGGDESSDDQDAEQAGDGTSTGGSTRRRRRRRRRGGDESAPDEESGDVVVRVREPRRSSNDEIAGIEGSTRLEAKKQRRREGRAAGRHRAPILSEAEFLARRESVDRVMLVRQREEYTQIAVLEDDVLVEHYVDRSSSNSLIGNIYLGRVQNVLPSMEAVFIDIGRGRNAVLYAGEVDWNAFDVSSDHRKVEQVFKSGQTVLVQVSKDPVGAKGARLTGHVSIPGRYVVYSPGGHLSGISRKLPDSERQRLKQVLDTVVSEESSVIVRTAAEGASTEELVHDVERLKAQWEIIERKAKQGSAPQQLYAEPDLTLRIIRDTFTEDFRQLIVAGNGGPQDAYDAIHDYIEHVAPHLMDRLVKWDAEQGDPFSKFRIDEQISKALERKVFLPSGGSLVIDRTEAMTVIDVNTGKFTGSGGNLEETVTRNNLEAAEEIVRQLRLRDLGGIIVIDFIDMVLPSNRDLLLRRLVECLGRDRTRHQVSEVTSLGLVQMTRKRIGTGLAEAFTVECEHCAGRGYVRHDEPVDTQAPADGGERHGRQPIGSSNRGRTKSTRSRAKTAEQPAPRANQVQPSEAAREAAAKLAAAASRHHAEHGGEGLPDETTTAPDGTIHSDPVAAAPELQDATDGS